MNAAIAASFSAFALATASSLALAVTPTFNSLPLSGPSPTIDGVMASGEWSGAPQIQMTNPDYPITTNVYFRHDTTYLYALVDAMGDTTDGNYDECLLVFDLPPNMKVAEIWKDPSGIIRRPGTVADLSEMGMSGGHRTYEFRIPFSALGIEPGQSLPFYSPKVEKMNGAFASIPFDSVNGILDGTDPDNVYPSNLNVVNYFDPVNVQITNYATLGILPITSDIPALSDWGLYLTSGLLGLAGLVGLASLTGLRRRPG